VGFNPNCYDCLLAKSPTTSNKGCRCRSSRVASICKGREGSTPTSSLRVHKSCKRFARVLAILEVVSKSITVEATGREMIVYPPVEERQTVETPAHHSSEVMTRLWPGTCPRCMTMHTTLMWPNNLTTFLKHINGNQAWWRRQSRTIALPAEKSIPKGLERPTRKPKPNIARTSSVRQRPLLPPIERSKELHRAETAPYNSVFHATTQNRASL
jgi:hypothetical protein